MDPHFRAHFNRQFTDDIYQRYQRDLSGRLNMQFDFRLAESPVFLPDDFKARAVAAPIPDEAPVITARRDLFSDTYPPSVFAALNSGPTLFPARRPPPVYSSGRRVSRRLPPSCVPWFRYFDRDFSYHTYQAYDRNATTTTLLQSTKQTHRHLPENTQPVANFWPHATSDLRVGHNRYN